MQLLNDYLLVEQETINRFKNSDLNELPFSVESNVKWRNGSNEFEFDIVIKHNSIPLAVVEIKRSLQEPHSLDTAKRQIDTAFKVLNCYYGIVTDNNDFYLVEINNKNYQKLDFDTVKSILQKHSFEVSSEPKQLLYSRLEKILYHYGFYDFVGEFKEYDGKLYFTDSTERRFWKQLLESRNKRPSTTIFRYTSLDTVFFLLKNGTYRMNGIVGMNDTSEIDYFDDYCYTSKNKPSYQILNNLFLSSCSSLEDNLTMWRLYGDDAKGVCLEFENLYHESEFTLQSVSYADEVGVNLELELIKELIKNNVVFSEIDKWKHFFKAKDYSIEKEIRLLFLDDLNTSIVKKRDWVKTSDHSIINPYIEFELKDPRFPLKLKTIVLGPKCPEQTTNKYQLEVLIRQNNYPISVKTSSIKNYR